MKRLKASGLTPISVRKAQGLFANSGKSDKRNQVTAIAVTKLREKQEREKNKKKGLKKDVEIPFLKNLGIGGSVKTEEIMAFTQNFHLLKRAGFNNVRALTTILENTENPALQDIIADILNGIEAGEYIYTTMEHYPKVFPMLYVSIIKVGEMSDSLAESLSQALSSLEDSKTMKRQVKKAVTQPIIMIGALIIMTIVAIVWGLPVMENLYKELGVEDQIPATTLAVSNFMKMIAKYWYVSVGIIAGIVVGFITWINTPSGRFLMDKFKYTMPIFGQLMIRLDLQKFLRAMQLNLENNAKLDDSMEVSKSVVKNNMFLAMVEAAQSNLAQGLSWVEPFEAYKFMPTMIIEMLKIGMETDIKMMMGKITEYIADDIEITMSRIMAVIPQVSMAIAGVVLVAFMIVVLKPIMEVYMGNFLFDAYGM